MVYYDTDYCCTTSLMVQSVVHLPIYHGCDTFVLSIVEKIHIILYIKFNFRISTTSAVILYR